MTLDHNAALVRRAAPGRQAVVATALVWAPMLLWWAAFRPGLMSSDSLSIWHQVLTGDWVDLHSPVYMAAMWLSRTIGDSPSLLTIGQSVFLAASLVAVSLAVERAGANRWAARAALGVLAVSPMVGAFSISLWKDVPYAAALLFMGARLVDLLVARTAADDVAQSDALWRFVWWAGAAVALRQNGIVLVILVLGVLFCALAGQRRRILAGAGVVFALLLGLKLVVYPLAGVEPTNTQAGLAMFLHDVAAVAHRDPSAIDARERALLERVAPFETWRLAFGRFGCSNANWEFDPSFRWEAVEGRGADYLRIWLDELVDNPRAVLRNRLCVGAIGFRPDGYGVVYTVSRGIDANDFGLRTVPLSDWLRDRGLDAMAWADSPGVRWWAWRAPGWIYLAYGALGLAALRRRDLRLLLPCSLLLALQVTVTAVNPAQDARYMFPGLLFAVLLLPLAVGANFGSSSARSYAVRAYGRSVEVA